MANDILNSNSDLKFLFGEIEAKQKKDGRIYLSGWASTPTPDYENDIIEPKAFEKSLSSYNERPIYCFNHDRDVPIGRVNSISIKKNGLYIDEAVLSETKLVKDFIAPLVLDNVLTQQSVGFFAMKGRRDGEFRRITEAMLLEVSLVSIACNPDAVLESVQQKGMPMFTSVEDYVEAYNKGEIVLPSKYYMDYHYKSDDEDTEEKNMTIVNSLSPDFGNIEVLQPTHKYLSKLDKSEESKTLPLPDKDSGLLPCVCLAKKGDTLMFPIGEVTDKGYKLHWDLVALNMGRIFGAKGEFVMTPATKAAIVERLGVTYTLLGKRIPEFNGASVVDLDEETLSTVKYHNVEFFEGEKIVIKNKILENDLSNLKNILEDTESNEFSDSVKEMAKTLYPYLSIGVNGTAYDQEDFDLFAAILSMCETYSQDKTDRMNAMMAYNLSDANRERITKLLELIPEMLTNYDISEFVDIELTEEQKKINDDFELALKSFYKN